MKKRIYHSLYWTALVTVLVSLLLSLWGFYGFYSKQAKADLKSEVGILARSLEYQGEQDFAYLKAVQGQFKDIRITIIEPDGSVSYDSRADAATMESHLSRPEVIAAGESGIGEAVRHSQTIGQDTYYCAIRISDGTIVRASRETGSLVSVFLNILPLVLGILLLILVLCYLLSAALTKRFMRPIEALAEGSETDAHCYDELEPMLHKIRLQRGQIQDSLKKLRAERDTIRTITEHMREGLVLLDKDGYILSVNQSALSLLGAYPGNYTGKTAVALTHHPEFSDSAERARKGENCSILLSDGGVSCRAYFSPVYVGKQIDGAIILVVDISEQQKAETMRREFTANVSHELKTPLTAISGYAEMIAQGMAKPDDVVDFADRIGKESARLIALIDDIMRLSQMEEASGQITETVNLKELCEETVDSLLFAAKQKEVSMSLHCPQISITANRRMIEELLFNLCDNAVKYNRPGGDVNIHVTRENGNAVITIADTGIGIPQKHQERIFERFYRVDKSRSKQTGGTGLGLSIVKHAVEYHGGTIRLDSREEVGTTITVTLPVAE